MLLLKIMSQNYLGLIGEEVDSLCIDRVHLTITVQNNPHKTDGLKMAIAEYIRNVNRAIPNTVFQNTVRRVNKCLENGGGHSEHYL